MEMIQIEFIESVRLAFLAFVAGVWLREYAPTKIGKWLGRCGVLVALFLMTAFGFHSVEICQLRSWSDSEAIQPAGENHKTYVANNGN
jgi:hypothetical protein